MRVVVTGRQDQVVQALLELAAPGRPEFDLKRPETLVGARQAARPDMVVSAAAYIAVDLAEREPERARVINAVGSGVLAQAAASLDVPIIHLSTAMSSMAASPRPMSRTISPGRRRSMARPNWPAKWRSPTPTRAM